MNRQRRRGKPRMKRRVKRIKLGRVMHYVKTGHLVVETPGFNGSPPPLGSKVELPGMGAIGVLMDIIGPVDKPFAVVKLEPGVDPSGIPEGAEVEVVVEEKERRPATRRRRAPKREERRAPVQTRKGQRGGRRRAGQREARGGEGERRGGVGGRRSGGRGRGRRQVR